MLLWCFCLLAESYETINHWPLKKLHSAALRGQLPLHSTKCDWCHIFSISGVFKYPAWVHWSLPTIAAFRWVRCGSPCWKKEANWIVYKIYSCCKCCKCMSLKWIEKVWTALFEQRTLFNFTWEVWTLFPSSCSLKREFAYSFLYDSWYWTSCMCLNGAGVPV